MKVYYKFIEEQNLLVQKVIGDWDTNLMINFHHFLMEQKEIEFVKNIFTDFRGVSLLSVYEDLVRISKLREQFHKNINKIVHLLDLPDSTAMSMLYSDLLKKNGHSSFSCSTIKKGLYILELRYTVDEMEFIFKNLEEFPPKI